MGGLSCFTASGVALTPGRDNSKKQPIDLALFMAIDDGGEHVVR